MRGLTCRDRSHSQTARATAAHGNATPRSPGQAITLHRGTWHGVLTPLSDPGLFAVLDRIGPGANLEEYWFDAPYTVTA
ncbi:ureidoglycolate hydrolase [Roseovarius sp. 217]|nr:ureidoglycolate hydrolase [Roseovarius sp. 217]